MKLNNTITIKPPKYTDHTGKLIDPPATTLDTINVTYANSPSNRTYSAHIFGFPTAIMLWANNDYIHEIILNKTTIDAENKLKEIIGENQQEFLQKLFPPTLEENPDGPGSLLSDMISTLGIKSTPNCACRKHAIEMNQNGPDWCEQNIDTILGWLKTESEKRKIPFVDSVARMMVNRAISKSRKLLATG